MLQKKRTRRHLLLALPLAALTLAGGAIFADWWIAIPRETTATFVGGRTCLECHQQEYEQWSGSHHDLAMAVATEQSVLGDFGNVTLEHYGVTSRMFRDGDKFMIHTEGPDGQLRDFEIKYVLGVSPLQQYMVEFDRPPGMPDDEIARLQVLRVSWDSQRNEWFYLSPPDVDERLAADDPLHWTRRGQNWNHMCAECHSTDLAKNYDLETLTYHTTFSDINVSCEACHGPGSVHVQLARSRSLFWDRKWGYGLTVGLKGPSAREPTSDTDSLVQAAHRQIESCGPCHSRRRLVQPAYTAGAKYLDHYANSLVRESEYYCDGQILDEVYVYGSFLQSKMYHQGIRCTDCHNPHALTLKAEGNQLCVSCHTHDPAKYDTPAHHRHSVGSTGASCVACHMPEAPFMDLDLRSDHRMGIPRPDLSVRYGVPNACTSCHLEPDRIDSAQRDRLPHYANWLTAARDGNEPVRAELDRVNRWAAETVRTWYGARPADEEDHQLRLAEALSRAWQSDPSAVPLLVEVAADRRLPAMHRASALEELTRFDLAAVNELAVKAVKDKKPLVRAAAVQLFAGAERHELITHAVPLLLDPIRYVRIQAALTLADLPTEALSRPHREALARALNEYKTSQTADRDQAAANLSLAVLAERMANRTPSGDPELVREAEMAYRTAIRVQPDVTGPRSNLSALLERQGRTQDVARLRAEEYELMQRDVRFVPDNALGQYRLGLLAYLLGKHDVAVEALSQAARIEPVNADYALALTLMLQKQQRWDEAVAEAQRLVTLEPENASYRQLLRELKTAANAHRTAAPVSELPPE